MDRHDEYFMEKAIDYALKSRREGNEPFGAILVKGEEVVKVGENKVHSHSDPTYHAEIGLIRDFCSEHNVFDLSDYTLYTSCEPCVMCSGAMVWSNLGKVVYSVSHDQLAEIAGDNIMISCKEVFEKSPLRPQVVERVLNEKGIEVFDGYTFG
ncbi:nucleoside deaminase [Pontibacillus yanchengensis]|uniref:Nucleoside deaminase n=1 Tax=Pontibacillus yanchengensis TaxID=462910 RepID=A0A6I4ZXV0_9BACI|nr:nucleoside deaminase [Pontibacillus yanchengensis]MYL32583.1 nucleoside deaminase [Pontibacillus yanchengensis]